MTQTSDVELCIPDTVRRFLRTTIEGTGGNEVFFLARVAWDEATRTRATVDKLQVVARGNQGSVPAIIARADDWDLAIHNHPSGVLEPSEADNAIAGELGNRGVGFAIISNDAKRHYLVTGPFSEPKMQPVDVDEVRQLFGPDGPLSRELEGFESREGQVSMATEVAEALNGDRIVALEAGTGVGKSFAYLIPAILWAVKNRTRVVVSTGTIQLQEQLVGKDLPFLARILPVKFGFALIKGRSNYACRRKVEELKENLATTDWVRDLLGDPQLEELKQLVEWVGKTGEGSRADLSWTPSTDAWEQAMSETDKSLKNKCKHYDKCFYYRARRQASNAHIVVVNHHLFFADVALRRQLGPGREGVLPGHARVIFDEAQHLEDVASEYLGARVSPLGVRFRLTRMCSAKDPQKGTLRKLVQTVRTLGDKVAAAAVERALTIPIHEALQHVESCVEYVRMVFPEDSSGRSAAAEGRGVRTVRYRHPPAQEEFWAEIGKQLRSIQKELGIIIQATDRAVESLSDARITADRIPGLLLELTSFATRLQSVIGDITMFLAFDDRSRVRWVEGKPGRGAERGLQLTFGAAPVRVGRELKENVYDRVKTVVFTSATLSVAGRFDFFADRLGLDAVGRERFSCRDHPSPFDFQRQVLTLIPTDLPGPESGAFDGAIPEAVFELVKASRGRAFVLFTSYSLLRKTHQQLAARLRELDLLPMAQGDVPRSALLDRFKASSNGVLFGTDSFWEGVDVKGRALECVVITRLPFRVPTEPLQEARVEELEERGVHPFMNFTLPQAVLKFKQGFGRLVRSTEDRGVVAVLDRRIITKPYGRGFLASLPDTRVVRGELSELVRQVSEFFQEIPGETRNSKSEIRNKSE